MRPLLIPLLSLSAVLLAACDDKGSGDPDTVGEEADAGADADADTDADVLAVLVEDDIVAEETAWAFGAIHLELSQDALTGTITYSEERDSLGQVCAGTLSVSGGPAVAQVCEDDPCAWSYTFTVDGTDITEGSCEYRVPDVALNLADPEAEGMLAYWQDADFWGDTYIQLMLLGYQSSEGWGAQHVLEETTDHSFGLDQYDPDAGTVGVDLGGTGVGVSLLYTEACADATAPAGSLIAVDAPLLGTVAEDWDALADIWEIALEAGETLQVSAVPTAEGGEMQVDLLSPDGCLQVAGDDGVDCGRGDFSYCGSLSYTASSPGTYRLAVTGAWCDGGACDYALHLAVE